MRTGGAGGGRARARPRAVATAAVAALAALALALPGAAQARHATGEPGAQRLVGIAPATPLGFSEYQAMNDGNVPTLRLPFFWQDIEPGPGSFNWNPLDQQIAYAAAIGARVRPFVMGVPDWVQQGSGSTDYPPVDSRFFTKNWKYLLTSLIKRYGPHGFLWQYLKAVAPAIRAKPIRTWQIWNEPNARTYWTPAATAPADYAKLLRISAGTIRAHDRGAEVVAAGLFLQPLDGVSMPDFVGDLYRQRGFSKSIDALALHPYARNVAGVIKQIRIARRLMASHDDADKPLWITELGWPTQRSYGRGLFVKSEGAQKRLLAATFSKILADRRHWRIGALIWYTWRDNDLFTTCDLCRFSGLFRDDLTPKPSWSAFTDVTGGSAQTAATASAAAKPPLPIPPSFGR